MTPCAFWSAAALLHIEPQQKAREVLAAGLKDEMTAVRLSAAEALTSLGPAARPMQAALTAALDDEDALVRCQAAAALLRIDPDQPKLLDVFRKALRDKEAGGQEKIPAILGQAGPVAVPVLIQALQHEDANVRVNAAVAIANAYPAPRNAVSALQAALRRTDALQEQVYLAAALLKLSPIDIDVRGVLVRGLQADCKRNSVIFTFQIMSLYNEWQPFPFLTSLLCDRDPDLRSFGCWGLLGAGPDTKKVMPDLLKALGDSDPDVRLKAAALLLRFDAPAANAVLGELLLHRDAKFRQAAADALPGAGPPALASLTVLTRDLDRTVRQEATHGLLGVGPTAIPVLIEALGDGDAGVRKTAADALIRVSGPKAKPYIPALLKVLKSEDADSRRAAAAALARMGPTAFPGVIDLLKHKDAAVRSEAADWLRSDVSLLPFLIDAIRDPQSNIRARPSATCRTSARKRRAAVPALVAILRQHHSRFTKDGKENPVRDFRYDAATSAGDDRPGGTRCSFSRFRSRRPVYCCRALLKEAEAPPIEVLVGLAQSEDCNLRQAAIERLREFGTRALPAVPVLIENLAGSSVPCVREAMETIVAAGPKALPAVMEALNSTNPDTRRCAAFILGRRAGSSKDVLAALIRALEDSDTQVRLNCLGALERMGPKAKAAAGAVLKANKDSEDSVAFCAYKALLKIAPVAVPELMDGLKDNDARVRAAAAAALGAAGAQAKAAVPALIEALKDQSEPVRRCVVDTLREIGPDAKAAVPALTLGLKDRNADLRFRCAGALLHFQPNKSEAIAALRSGLKDSQEEVRVLALQTLMYCGPEAKALVPTLLETLKDKSQLIRSNAAGALISIDPAAARKAGVVKREAPPEPVVGGEIQ